MMDRKLKPIAEALTVPVILTSLHICPIVLPSKEACVAERQACQHQYHVESAPTPDVYSTSSPITLNATATGTLSLARYDDAWPWFDDELDA